MAVNTDYSLEQVKAVRSVLVELMLTLGQYREHLVLIGGWVPALLIQNPSRPHVGSIDVDLAVDHGKLDEPGYSTIRQLMLQRGYDQDEMQPFVFRRQVRELVVEVGMMADEYGGTGSRRRHQRVADTHLRKARGCDIAFDDPRVIVIEDQLPEGGRDQVEVPVASVAAFICMKGMALDGRLKEKDAWDIYFCVREYPGGVQALAEHLREKIGHGLVREALEKISRHFETPDHRGPRHVADFEGIDEEQTREIVQRDAYQRVKRICDILDV